MNKAIKSCFTISLQCRTAKLTLSDHFRNNSGSLAMFAAIRRASSRVSNFAAGFYFASQILIAPTITLAAASAARNAHPNVQRWLATSSACFSASQFPTPPR
jgi:hypothetical protein